MDRILLIKIQVYGIYNLTSIEFSDNNSTLLDTDHSEIYVLEPEERAIDDDFDSLWIIEEWTVFNLPNSISDLAVVLYYFDQNSWILYASCSLK